jgi:hypothetical protein
VKGQGFGLDGSEGGRHGSYDGAIAQNVENVAGKARKRIKCERVLLNNRL